MNGRYLKIVARCVTVVVAAWCAGPQASVGGQDQSTLSLASATVSVRDAGGRPMTGLPPSAFRVTQKGKPVPWRVVDALPRDILLLLDYSGSQAGGAAVEGRYLSDDGRSVRGETLAGRTGTATVAIARALGARLAAEDRARVATFGDGGLVSEYQRSGEGLARALPPLRQHDAPSPLWDAVFGLPELFRAVDRVQPVVLVVTDGLATANIRSHAEALGRVRDSNLLVYTASSRVGLDATDGDPTALSPRLALRALADATGARLFEVRGPLTDMIDGFFDDLAKTYSLSIGPLNDPSDLTLIEVSRKDVTVVVRWLAR